MLGRFALVLIPAIFGACAAVALLDEPAAAQTPEPSATRVAHPAIILHIIDDLNGDGIRQASEPGLAGWSAYEGCSDALAVLGPTDASGEFRTPYANSDTAAFDRCFRLERKFGWLPTSPISFTKHGQPGGTVEVTFLVRDFGRDAMELSGEAITAGVPARDVSLTLGAPFASCSGAFVEPATWRTAATIIVTARSTRAGCPADGQVVYAVMNGAPQGSVSFAPGRTEATDFVVGGDSMRLFTGSADRAEIDGRDCSVAAAVPGLVPEGYVRIFVLSDETRAGCGTMNRPVRFLKGAQPLDPTLAWLPGAYDQFIDFLPTSPATPAPVLRVTPPDTGMGAPSGNRADTEELTLSLALVAGVTGVVCLALARRLRASLTFRR